MTWIATISYSNADGRLRQIYERIKGPGDTIDNILSAHSLKPHTLEGHMALYKYVLHHSANETPKWFMEALGVYVSLLNRCDYCIEHHSAGLKRLLNDAARADALLAALQAEAFDAVFEPREVAALHYAKALTLQPPQVDEGAIQAMREVGWSDGEILEVNQVVAYFAYANRTAIGLGVTTQGDILGLSPSDAQHG